MKPYKQKDCCYPHQRGVNPLFPLTFSPTCPKCLELLEAGKRTGNEPHPSTVYMRTKGTMFRMVRGEARDALAAKRRERLAIARETKVA